MIKRNGLTAYFFRCKLALDSKSNRSNNNYSLDFILIFNYQSLIIIYLFIQIKNPSPKKIKKKSFLWIIYCITQNEMIL